MLDTSNEAKVSLILDINNALKSIKILQERLDNISIKNIQVEAVKEGIEVIGNTLVKTGGKIVDVRKRLRELKREVENYAFGKINYQSDPKYIAYQKEISDLENFLKAVHNKSKVIPVDSVLGMGAVEKYEKYAEEAMKAEMQITNTALDYRREQITAYKKYQDDAENIRQNSVATYSFKKEIEATKALLEHQENVKKNYRQFNSIADSVRNKTPFINKDLEATEALLNHQESVKKNYRQFENIANSVKQKPLVNDSLAKEIEATQELIKYQQQTIANYKKFNEIAKSVKAESPKTELSKLTSKSKSEIKNAINEFKSYSSEMAKIEKRLAVIYHELNNPLPTTNFADKRKELEVLTKQYNKLNRESVEFRKLVGISQTRGIYDLNHNLDYFRSKVRSRLVYSFATELDNLLMYAPQQFISAMSNFQQNKVNFAQVLPDYLANNQEVMNGAIKEFTHIASDYGTSVNEVVEAGRLWGRQYKDIAIVQELVRNSTKLSITDNMSLTEVNKGLEATLQQYNVHLKDANEAQQVSGKVVDTWAKLADNAVVTAQDLAKANERSAGSAYQAGIGFDYLQAMITTMSSATGKAGGEIGRSIRSMLISMRSEKAEKEFAKLGIATTELVNGERRIRSFEKVITELMQKLKTSPKDVYALINAMAGGKYQFNNVMALLKNYEQFMKNLEIAKNSQGWADEQVGRQYETISRQIQALTADFQQLLLVLDKAGIDNGIVDIIKDVREFVQALQGISPEMINWSLVSVEWLIKLKAMGLGLSFIDNYLRSTSANMSSFTGILSNFSQKTISGKTALKMFAGALLSNITNILTLIPLLISLYGIIEGYHKNRDNYYNFEVLKDTDNQIQALQDFQNAYTEYSRIINDSTSGEVTKKHATEELIKAQEKLKSIIGDSAYQRIHDSNDVVKAIEAQIQAIRLETKESARRTLEYEKGALKKAKIDLETSKQRIEQNRAEFESNKALLLQRIEMLKLAGFSEENDLARNMFGINGLEQSMNDSALSITQETEKANKLRAKIEELEKAIKKLNSDYKQSDLAGAKSGTLDEETKNLDKGFSEQTKRNQLERERNQLWLQGKIEAQAYENALKSITNLEQAYGSTEYSINQKTSLFTSRKADLESYQNRLINFRNDLISIVDAEMQANQKVAEIVGYKSDMTLKDKLQHFEVNKELYQQEKTYSAIINLISTVNSEIEKTKGKTQEITNSLMQQEKSLYNARVDEINRKYQLEDTMLNRPTNYNYETQKVRLQIEQEKELIAEKNNYIDTLNKQLVQAIKDNDIDKIKAIKHNIATENILKEQQYQKLAELENQKNYNIRNGLAEITQSFLIEGNSLKDIWKNLWQDLAREAIQRLFQVKATASLLGSLFGLFGGSPNVFTKGELDPMKITSLKAHTGANIGTYPKMHTGGVVANGRIGVVPKLQNNEVIRTLQVGEEVNSLQDRRSNEMLTAIVLKALDSKNEKPTNVNIFAMDSKSFAEYLNDNADILTAVLAKQGAMNRR